MTNQPAKCVEVALLHPTRGRHLPLAEVASWVDDSAFVYLHQSYVYVRVSTPGWCDSLPQNLSSSHLREG